MTVALKFFCKNGPLSAQLFKQSQKETNVKAASNKRIRKTLYFLVITKSNTNRNSLSVVFFFSNYKHTLKFQWCKLETSRKSQDFENCLSQKNNLYVCI